MENPFNCMSSLVKKGSCNIFPAIYPKPKETINSKNRIMKKLIFVTSPLINAFEMDKQIANSIITKTSLSTVTPITVLVNGPFALISLITAIADEGDRATNIVANNTATAIL